MYDRLREEMAWLRLQDIEREAENRRLLADRSPNRHFLDAMGERIWRDVGVRFGWLSDPPRPTLSDVA